MMNRDRGATECTNVRIGGIVVHAVTVSNTVYNVTNFIVIDKTDRAVSATATNNHKFATVVIT